MPMRFCVKKTGKPSSNKINKNVIMKIGVNNNNNKKAIILSIIINQLLILTNNLPTKF